jgi:Helix-turn-helix domain
MFGLSRSKLYELINDRKIKSFCLRERNKIKGIRLISFDSLSEFLENEAREQQEISA